MYDDLFQQDKTVTTILEIQLSETLKLKKIYNYFAPKVIMLQFNDHYKIIKKIGQGSFASVYLIHHRETQKQLAIKAILKEKIQNEDKGLESFFNETNIMKQLSHENILKLYEIWENQHSFFYVIELSNFGSLKERIQLAIKQTKKNQQRDALLEDEIRLFMYQLFQGLVYLQEKKIMHRDIKPENILLRKLQDQKNPNQTQLQAFYIDFGLATSTKLKEYLFYKCGTPGFVSPEILNMQSNQKVKYGYQCDVFSLGAIFYQMLTLQPLFYSDKPKGTLKLNIECNIDFISGPISKVDKAAFDLIKRMLEKSPELRITPQEALRHEYFDLFNKQNQFDEEIHIPEDDFASLDEQFRKFNSQIFNVQKINIFINKEKPIIENSFRDESLTEFISNVNNNIYGQQSKQLVSLQDWGESLNDTMSYKSKLEKQISNCSLVLKAPQNQAGNTNLYLGDNDSTNLLASIRQKNGSSINCGEHKPVYKASNSIFKQDYERQRANSDMVEQVFTKFEQDNSQNNKSNNGNQGNDYVKSKTGGICKKNK